MKRILIVDDSNVVRRLHGYLLRGEGYEVVEAANGFDALEKMAQESYGLILIDINMPKMDGVTLTREIRANPEWADLPIIIISTQRNPKDIQQGQDAGANTYLVKPVDPDDLVDKVNQLLSSTRPEKGSEIK